MGNIQRKLSKITKLNNSQRRINHQVNMRFQCVNDGKYLVYYLLQLFWFMYQIGMSSSNFGVGFGFLQKSVYKKTDISRIEDSWNFSGLWIFGLQIADFSNIFQNVFKNKNIYVLNFAFLRFFTLAFLLFLAPTAVIF